jgi:cytochrome b subunit of formate dehydrogenase
MLGGLAASREAAYRHARKVSQYGHGTGMEARDPITSAFVINGVALVVVIVSGIVMAVSGPGSTTGMIASYIYFVALAAWAVTSLIILLLYWPW